MSNKLKFNFPIITLIIIILLTTFASGFHFNYYKESFEVIKNSGSVKNTNDIQSVVQGNTEVKLHNTKKTNIAESASLPSDLNNTELNNKSLLQPAYSRFDYINDNTNETNDLNINNNINTNLSPSTKQQTFYDKAIDFFES